MTGTFANFSHLPLEIQRIILSQNDVATRRSISSAFSDLQLYEHCRTPITIKELENFLVISHTYRIGMFWEYADNPKNLYATGEVLIPWDPEYKLIGTSRRSYSTTLYKNHATQEYNLYISARNNLSWVQVEFSENFKLDYKTSYNILKNRINCRFIENYPKRYILDQFDEYVHQINYDDLYSVALAYIFLSLNVDILYPDIPFEEENEIVSLRKSPVTGKLVPIDINQYRDSLKWYSEQVNYLIIKIRAALDNLE